MFWLSVKIWTRISNGKRSRIETRREDSALPGFLFGSVTSFPVVPGLAGVSEEVEAAELIWAAAFFLPRTWIGVSGILDIDQKLTVIREITDATHKSERTVPFCQMANTEVEVVDEVMGGEVRVDGFVFEGTFVGCQNPQKSLD